jgi:phage anti-repressor protein
VKISVELGIHFLSQVICSMDLTPEVVFSLIQSDEKFPIDFDDAWQWIGYSRKDNAKTSLSSNFVEGLDFSLSFRKSFVGRPTELITLTIECFKSFCMMAGTPRGREVRLYFLNCEAELRRKLEEERNQQQANTKQRLVGSIVSKDIVSRYPKFDDEFYELLYKKRGNGWENRDPKNRPVCVANWTNTVVYNRLYGGIDQDGVKAKLLEVNPVQENGRRKDLHHWHLKHLGEFHLSSHLAAVKAIARLSPDGYWDRFLYNVKKGLPNGEALQLNLLEYMEFLEYTDSIAA